MPDFSFTDPNFDFDEAQKALDRKRKFMAAIIAQPATESSYRGKYYVPNYGAAQKGILDAIGAYGENEYDKQGADLARGKNEAISQWLKERPEDTPAAPATPAVVGTGPIAPPPGTPGVDQSGGGSTPMNTPEPGPNALPSAFSQYPQDTPAVWDSPKGMDMVPKGAEFTPNLAAKPAMPLIPAPLTKVAEWAGKANRFGGVMDDFAKKALEYSVTQPERSRLAHEASLDRNERQHALLLQQKEIEVEKSRQRQQEIDRKIESDKNNLTLHQMKNQADAQYQQGRLELLQMRADAASANQGTYAEAGTTLEGNTVLRNSKRPEDQVEIKNGQRVPYDGPIVMKGEEKDVKGAMAAETEARVASKLAGAISSDKEVFSPGANFGATVSTWLGGFAKEELSGLTPEQLGLRGVIGRDFAETTKKLYGASFTSTEQTRANGFTPQANDSTALVIEKLNGAAQFAREMAEKYGTKVQQAAMKRLRQEGEAPPAAAPPGSPAPNAWGKAQKVGG